MATLSLTELETALKGLDLATPVPHFDSADVLTKPLDLIRSYLADILSSLIDADRTAAYKSISLSNSSLHGDLTVVLPKLKPGCNAGELAADLIKKVCTTSISSHSGYRGRSQIAYSFPNVRSSVFRGPMASTYGSVSRLRRSLAF